MRTSFPSALAAVAALAGAVSLSLAAEPKPSGTGKPNILLILADNLGYGELSCYGGVRMVATPRIDKLATEGLRLTNFNVEAWCSPSRSALLTGRYGIRSGMDQVSPGLQGMVQWEITLAELLSARGYATALYGKWHLGEQDGRYPTDQGFDEWYGIQRSWDAGMITATPGYIPKAADMPFILEGVKGKKTQQGDIFDAEVGERIDSVLTDTRLHTSSATRRRSGPSFCMCRFPPCTCRCTAFPGLSTSPGPA